MAHYFGFPSAPNTSSCCQQPCSCRNIEGVLQVKIQSEVCCGCHTSTLPETNIAPENRPLEKEIPIGNHHFQVLLLLVSGRVPVVNGRNFLSWLVFEPPENLVATLCWDHSGSGNWSSIRCLLICLSGSARPGLDLPKILLIQKSSDHPPPGMF